MIKDILFPQAPSIVPLKTIVDKLTAHFQPAPSEIVQRFHFHSRVCCPQETVATYVAQLKQPAEHCKFSDSASLDPMLRNCLVCGTKTRSDINAYSLRMTWLTRRPSSFCFHLKQQSERLKTSLETKGFIASMEANRRRDPVEQRKIPVTVVGVYMTHRAVISRRQNVISATSKDTLHLFATRKPSDRPSHQSN